jgi:hypothetical protein
MRRAAALLSLSLAAGCQAPVHTPAGDDVDAAIMDRLRFDMSVSEARGTLARERMQVDEDGPYHLGKGRSVLATSLNVKGALWEGRVSFEDGAMGKVSVWWPPVGKPDQATRLVEGLTRRFGAGSRRASFHQVWTGIKSRLRVEVELESEGWHIRESWSALYEPVNGPRSDDPRFRYHDGWTRFPWGTPFLAMAATVTGTTPLRFGAWPAPECAEDPAACSKRSFVVDMRDGERTGTARFHGDRLEGVGLDGLEPEARDPDEIVAGYAARFGPPSEDHRKVEHSFHDGAISIHVTVESRQPEAQWTVRKTVWRR